MAKTATTQAEIDSIKKQRLVGVEQLLASELLCGGNTISVRMTHCFSSHFRSKGVAQEENMGTGFRIFHVCLLLSTIVSLAVAAQIGNTPMTVGEFAAEVA